MGITVKQRERQQFERDMAKNVAKLTDFAAPYVGRLAPSSREDFLERALEEAWKRRKQFAPTKASLLSWWDGCLRAARDSRSSWTIINSENNFEVIPSSRLGK